MNQKIRSVRQKYRDAQAVLADLKPRRRKAKQDHENAVKAQQFIQAFCQSIQEKTYGKISDLVTSCLQAVFPEPYRFRILFDKKRGKAEARPVFLRGKEEFDPVTECGGGVVDVTAFALRLATLRPMEGPYRQVLFLDEPTKHLSSAHRQRFGRLVERLSAELNVQMVIITHDRELCDGKIIEV